MILGKERERLEEEAEAAAAAARRLEDVVQAVQRAQELPLRWGGRSASQQRWTICCLRSPAPLCAFQCLPLSCSALAPSPTTASN